MNANSFRADPRRARAFSEPRPQTRRGLNFRSLSLVAWLAIAVVAAGARDASAQIDPGGATIIGLSIVFDEGTDPGVGFVFLDNITVEVNGVAKTWTFAGDNAGSDLTLHPSGFGEHSYAAWKAQQGQADSRGSALLPEDDRHGDGRGGRGGDRRARRAARLQPDRPLLGAPRRRPLRRRRTALEPLRRGRERLAPHDLPRLRHGGAQPGRRAGMDARLLRGRRDRRLH